MAFRKHTPDGRGLGWRPQTPDKRDLAFRYHPAPHVAQDLPEEAYTKEFPIWDQGALGSCTGNGVAHVVLDDAVRQALLKPTDVPSRLMIYYNERVWEGTVKEDAGAEIRDGIKVVAKYGVCLEAGPSSWPYDTSKFTRQPPKKCYTKGLKFQAISYHTVTQDTLNLRACIAEGFPIVFGFACYPELDSSEVARTGLLPMPAVGAECIGGHCVTIVGYDNTRRLFKLRNSWGDTWGDRGYFWMPYEYVIRRDLSSDFWTIRTVG